MRGGGRKGGREETAHITYALPPLPPPTPYSAMLCYAMPLHHYNNGLIEGGLDDALELISVPTRSTDRPTNNRFSGKSAKGCKGVAGLRVRARGRRMFLGVTW